MYSLILTHLAECSVYKHAEYDDINDNRLFYVLKMIDRTNPIDILGGIELNHILTSVCQTIEEHHPVIKC